MIGANDKNGLFLINAGKPEQVGVLAEWKIAVTVARHFIVAVEEGNGVWLQRSNKSFTMVDVEAAVNSGVFHEENNFMLRYLFISYLNQSGTLVYSMHVDTV